MARHTCLNSHTTHDLARMRVTLAKRPDEDVVRPIRRVHGLVSTNWYRHMNPYHRWFLRQLYVQAHERKLEVPKFEWPKGGVA